MLRLPETLPESRAQVARARDVLAAFRQTVTNRQTIGYALAAGSVMGALFAYVFCRSRSSPASTTSAIIFRSPSPRSRSAPPIAGFLNAQLVGRLGMRVISHGALTL